MPPKTKFPGPVPEEALKYFGAKGLRIGFDYDDVWKEEHQVSFTAAKVVELDVLKDLRDIVDRAIRDGITFQQFQKDAGMLLDQSGWSNYHKQTPKKSRLRTIYQTNLRVARTVGQWQRIQRTKTTQPYLLYQLGPSARHRPEHVNWAGTLLPVDDPFWNYATPPSGWLCKCHLLQITKERADRAGGVTERPKLVREPWRNKKTGKVEMVPKGIDPGWDYNPGAVTQAQRIKRIEES